MSAMANVPIKAKQIYYIMFCIPKNVILFIFFEQKKNIEQKNICPKNSRNSEYAQFLTYDNFP